MPLFKLRFPASQLRAWANCNEDEGYLKLQNKIDPTVISRGYLQRNEFFEICAWKTPRTKS